MIGFHNPVMKNDRCQILKKLKNKKIT